jgi:hypothetical protein
MEKNFVMNFGELGDSIFYRVACDCSDPQCDMTLEFEYDPDYNAIYLNLYNNLIASAHWGYTTKWGWFDFVRVLINKVTMCWKIITVGYIEVSSGFILKDKKQINDFITALETGKKHILHKRHFASIKELNERTMLCQEKKEQK